MRSRITYRQDWSAYNAAQANEKAKFQLLLAELCRGLEEPLQTRGRPRLPLADMIFTAGLKTYVALSGRRLISDLREAHAKGHLSRLPSRNAVFNYLELEAMTPYLRALILESARPLKEVETDFAVDSSGFRTYGFVRWFNARYGKEQSNHDWLKVHLMCGVKTNIVTSVEISGRHAHDSPYFKPLVRATAESGFTLAEVSADKAYSSRANLRLVQKHGGMPYIAFKDNARGDGKDKVWNKVFHYYCLHREEYMARYHKRSNVESTFWMIKAKFGEQIRSRNEVAQTNEALSKVLCHNLCVVIQSMYELGVDPVFWGDADYAERGLAVGADEQLLLQF